MDERDAAVAQLRQVLGALDRDRDELATDADAKAEEVQRLAQSTEKALQAAADLEAQLAEAREQAAQLGQLLAASDAQVVGLGLG